MRVGERMAVMGEAATERLERRLRRRGWGRAVVVVVVVGLVGLVGFGKGVGVDSRSVSCSNSISLSGNDSENGVDGEGRPYSGKLSVKEQKMGASSPEEKNAE